jgi:CRISPR-associated protein Csb2
MSYFGRAESVCEAALIPDAEAISGVGWCHPTNGRRISERCRDVFCPNPHDFQATDVWVRRAGIAGIDLECAPKHFVDTLLSSDMKPDGATWVSYEMPSDWPEKRVVRTARTARKKSDSVRDVRRVAHYMRFDLQCRVPIPPKFTVPLAEQFRSEASRQFVRRFGSDEKSFALFGHPEDRPLEVVAEHQHAFYLPTQSLCPQLGEEGGFITELHVWCPYGLTSAEAQILMGIQRLIWKDGRYPVRPVLTALGKEPPSDLPLATGPLASKTWRTLTPFVPPRHYRRNGFKQKFRVSESPENQLIRYLRMAGVKTSGEVHRLGLAGDRLEQVRDLPPLPLWSIVRAPDAEGREPVNAVLSPVHVPAADFSAKQNRQQIGFFLEVTFDTETALPIPAMGHSNHFGLGVMVPAMRKSPTVYP